MTDTTPRNAISWFEIPVRDLDRAIGFYSAVLQAPLKRESVAGMELGVFPYDPNGAGGCLLATPPELEPSRTGTLVYLDVGASLDPVLQRVGTAGGGIATPKVQLPGDMGCFAHVVDSEGNRVGLHARS